MGSTLYADHETGCTCILTINAVLSVIVKARLPSLVTSNFFPSGQYSQVGELFLPAYVPPGHFLQDVIDDCPKDFGTGLARNPCICPPLSRPGTSPAHSLSNWTKAFLIGGLNKFARFVFVLTRVHIKQNSPPYFLVAIREHRRGTAETNAWGRRICHV